MPYPAELVQTVSAVTGAPLPTLTDIDRRLSIDGLRTKTGRGRNAARMTPRDAALLLTALLASPQATLAADAVRSCERAQPDRTLSSPTLFEAAGIEELGVLPSGHSFIDGIAALIASASQGCLARLDETAWPHIEIQALTRVPCGQIRLSGLPSGQVAVVAYRPVLQRTSLTSLGDLEQSRRVSGRTIFAIGELLKQGAPS